MKLEVYASHIQPNVDGVVITADGVKCKFLGKAEKTHTIMEAIKIHNEKMKALVDMPMKIGVFYPVLPHPSIQQAAAVTRL